jgi:DNA-dependent RNA polymerase auxiliary subunit epsilon
MTYRVYYQSKATKRPVCWVTTDSATQARRVKTALVKAEYTAWIETSKKEN